MALIACRECGREVSDQAAACPHCGCPVASSSSAGRGQAAPPPVPSSPKKTYGCGTLIVALITLLIVVSCFSALRNSGSGSSLGAPTTAAPSRPSLQEDPAARARQLAFVTDASNPTERRLTTARQLAAGPAGAPETVAAREAIPALEEALRKEQIGKQWLYASHDDEMSGKASKSASVLSTNQFEFDFPYQGKQRARLTIRRHPRWGNDVIFAIEKGQILCHSYSRCSINIRFDDNPPRRLNGNEPADNSSETVFIPGYNDFVTRLSRAKKLRVEVEIYQQGNLVAEFDVEGFDASKLK